LSPRAVTAAGQKLRRHHATGEWHIFRKWGIDVKLVNPADRVRDVDFSVSVGGGICGQDPTAVTLEAGMRSRVWIN